MLLALVCARMWSWFPSTGIQRQGNWERLEGCGGLMQVLSVVGILQDEADPMVSVMKVT